MIQPKITLIGGGTGSFTLLQALKKVTPNISALVNMADDGGSTGILRDELGVLPPGDVRQCLVALSDASPEVRDLFNFRFPNGTFAGHSFGNIFISAVEKMTSNFEDGVRMAGEILRITGRVLPISLESCVLQLALNDLIICGQRQIDLTQFSPHARPTLSLKGKPVISAASAAAIKEASLIAIAPGNLYASLAPALIVDGVAGALAESSAPIVFVCNLVNKPNHTAGYGVHEYAEEIERFITPAKLDYVLFNVDEPTPTLLNKYALKDEHPVHLDERPKSGSTYRLVNGNFLSHDDIKRDSSDMFIDRSLIRHNATAVVSAMGQLLHF